MVVNYHSDAEGAEELVKAIEAKGGKALAIKADVSKEDQVQAMFRQTIENRSNRQTLNGRPWSFSRGCTGFRYGSSRS